MHRPITQNSLGPLVGKVLMKVHPTVVPGHKSRGKGWVSAHLVSVTKRNATIRPLHSQSDIVIPLDQKKMRVWRELAGADKKGGLTPVQPEIEPQHSDKMLVVDSATMKVWHDDDNSWTNDQMLGTVYVDLATAGEIASIINDLGGDGSSVGNAIVMGKDEYKSKMKELEKIPKEPTSKPKDQKPDKAIRELAAQPQDGGLLYMVDTGSGMYWISSATAGTGKAGFIWELNRATQYAHEVGAKRARTKITRNQGRYPMWSGSPLEIVNSENARKIQAECLKRRGKKAPPVRIEEVRDLPEVSKQEVSDMASGGALSHDEAKVLIEFRKLGQRSKEISDRLVELAEESTSLTRERARIAKILSKTESKLMTAFRKGIS